MPETNLAQRLRSDAPPLLVLPLLGLACVTMPVVIRGESLMPAPLFPLLRTAVEQLNWMPIAALAALGLMAGVFTRLWPPLIALASVAALPVAMIAEIVADPTSHNLFPFELVMYAAMALPVLLAALAGRWIRMRTPAQSR